jgi:hypothetical protein
MSTTADENVSGEAGTVDGIAAAALVSGGIGTFVLGLLTTLNEASGSVHGFLDFHAPVGPLSGKTIIASGAYIVSLVLLGLVWRERTLQLRSVLIGSIVLLVLGLLGTFPEFFTLFAE